MLTVASLALVLAASPAPVAKPRLVVLELASGGGLDRAVAQALAESITAEVSARGFFEVVSSSEVSTLLGAERQRKLLGCSDDSCSVELADALGARFLMSGSLTQLGDALQLNLQTLDSKTGKPLGRATKLASSLESVRQLIPYAVAEACGTTLPPPPSRALPYTLLSVGGAAVIGGGVLGILGLTSESAIAGELAADDRNATVVLQPAATYRQRLASASLYKTVGLVSLGVGAALIAAGLAIMPPDAPQVGAHAHLVLTGTGVAVVGVFP